MKFMEMSFGGLNLHKTDLKITAGLGWQLIKNGLPQIAFAGRSNVGKSSLMNSLLGRKKLARVSSEPGKTITVNYYEVDSKLMLVDLPGYGFARRPKGDIEKWSALTQQYFENNDALKCVLQLVDIRIGLTEDDKMMLDWINNYGYEPLLVATKLDKLKKSQVEKNLTEIYNELELGEGREVLWGQIVSAM